MRYSIKPRDRIYVKGYGLLSFAKNMGKNLNSKYDQKLLDSAKKSTSDTIKTASKRAIQKIAEATGDKIANKITSDCNWTRTHNHLIRKRILNHLNIQSKSQVFLKSLKNYKIIKLMMNQKH